MSESESYPKAEFFRKPICPNIYRMYRSVDWTHDMTIVKWHLAQSLRSDKCATGLIHTKGSMTINVIPCQLFCRSGLCFVPSPIHLRSKLQATIILAGITIYWSLRKIYFEKYFLYLMITNVMMKTCLNQKIMKISNFIQAVKCSVCPKAKVIRRPNFSESQFCPNIYRMYGSVDWTNDMTIAKWHLAQTLRSDKCATGSIHTNGSMTINVIPC